MEQRKSIIYIIGYGNRFRQDDGLGPELAGMIENLAIEGVTVVEKFQLSFEDAYDISAAEPDYVFFLDALNSGNEPFCFYPVEPSEAIHFSIPLMTPGEVLSMCSTLFNKNIRGYVIGIRGYEWEFSSRFSDDALVNLYLAYGFLKDIINIILIHSYSFEYKAG